MMGRARHAVAVAAVAVGVVALAGCGSNGGGQGAAKIKAHQEAAVQLSRQYASARDACKAHDRAVTE